MRGSDRIADQHAGHDQDKLSGYERRLYRRALSRAGAILIVHAMIARGIVRILSWLPIAAVIVMMAAPGTAMAAPSRVAAAPHVTCSNCGDAMQPLAGLASAPMKAMPCMSAICPGALAAVLPAGQASAHPAWVLNRYSPGVLDMPNGRQLPPDPQPPRRSVRT